jgi:hypothetical protein
LHEHGSSRYSADDAKERGSGILIRDYPRDPRQAGFLRLGENLCSARTRKRFFLAEVTMRRARENPCASDRVLQERFWLDASGWALLGTRLRGLRHRGAIVGPPGSGKTTLLEELARRFTAQGWGVVSVRLTVEHPALGLAIPRRRLAALGSRDLLLIDGAEQLSPWPWWLVRFRARKAGGLIITTHTPGRLPTLWRCQTSPELLRDLVGSLGVPLAVCAATDLFERHRGNLREAIRELYDRHAENAG